MSLFGFLIAIPVILLLVFLASRLKLLFSKDEVLNEKASFWFMNMGPSEIYIRTYLEYADTNSISLDDLNWLHLLEVNTAAGRYEDAMQTAQKIDRGMLLDADYVRYLNAVLHSLTMLGRTEEALTLFGQKQEFIEANLGDNVNGMLRYLDNAVTICGLIGDISLASEYMEAMRACAEQYHIFDNRVYLVRITQIKLEFLMWSQNAAQHETALRDEIMEHDFQRPWEKQYYLDLLEETFLFEQKDQPQFLVTPEEVRERTEKARLLKQKAMQEQENGFSQGMT